jgi:hypothetical protein
MKNIVLLLGLFSCFNIEAQTTINKPVVCAPTEQVKVELERLGEQAVWTSPSPVEKSEYIFYGNRQTGTWSLVQIVDGVGCLVAFGNAPKAKGDL